MSALTSFAANLGLWLPLLGFLALAATMLAVFIAFPSGKITTPTVTPAPNNPSAPAPKNTKRDSNKKVATLYRSVELNIVSSFFLFVGIAWLLAVIAGLITNLVVGGGGIWVSILSGLGLSTWVILRGQVKNGETEKSVIAIFGTMTSLVSGPGLTFGLPEPIGSQVRKASTERQFISASEASNDLFKEVKTRDGATMEFGGNWEYEIVNTRQYAQYNPDEHRKAKRALIERVIRLIALYFDSDEEHSTDRNSSLANQKLGISKFFLGEPLNGPAPEGAIGQPIENDIAEQCQLLGTRFIRVNITDILEPEEVRAARAGSAKELAEREKETRDVDTLHETTLRLMWGGEDLLRVVREKGCTIAEAAEHLEQSGRTPVMSREAAAIATRTARGDATQIIGGDFTIAEVLRQGGVRRKT